MIHNVYTNIIMIISNNIKHVDSRDLIRTKFMKKSRVTTATASDSNILYNQEPDINTDDIIPPTINDDNQYQYLVDEPFSKIFDSDNAKIDDKPIFLCMYIQNTHLALPYITYCLNNSNVTCAIQNTQTNVPLKGYIGHSKIAKIELRPGNGFR